MSWKNCEVSSSSKILTVSETPEFKAHGRRKVWFDTEDKPVTSEPEGAAKRKPIILHPNDGQSERERARAPVSRGGRGHLGACISPADAHSLGWARLCSCEVLSTSGPLKSPPTLRLATRPPLPAGRLPPSEGVTRSFSHGAAPWLPADVNPPTCCGPGLGPPHCHGPPNLGQGAHSSLERCKQS